MDIIINKAPVGHPISILSQASNYLKKMFVETAMIAKKECEIKNL